MKINLMRSRLLYRMTFLRVSTWLVTQLGECSINERSVVRVHSSQIIFIIIIFKEEFMDKS